VVLNFSDDNSRVHMAESLGRDNYWEFNVVKNKPDSVVSRITEVFDGLPIGKAVEYPGPVRRPLSLEDKAALFEGRAVTTRLLHSVLHSTGKGELRELVEKATDDPLLCCIGAKSLESGYQMDIDVVKAIQWYRKAYKLGVPWAKKKVVDLKGRMD